MMNVNGFLSVWDALRGGELRALGESGLMWATAAGFAALPLALVVLFVNVAGRRWLSAGQVGCLWCLVLLRLLLPSAPASPLSLQNLLPQPDTSVVTDARIGFTVDLNNSTEEELSGPAESPVEIVAGTLLAHPTTMPVFADDPVDAITALCELAWLAAAFVIPAWTLFLHWRFRRRVRQTPVCRDERMQRLWDRCCTQAGLRGVPPIVLFDGVRHPAVMGVIHPELLLPLDAAQLSDAELEMVMLHELAHVRRWDIAINWAMVALRATQWWNPVYWIAAGRFRSLREQACDAFVVRTLRRPVAREYSELLLSLAQRPSGGGWQVMLPASLLGFIRTFLRKREIGLRLRALKRNTARRGRLHSVGALMLLALVALAGFTDAQMPQSSSQDVPLSCWFTGEPTAAYDGVVIQPGGVELSRLQGPLETRVHSVDEALEHLRREGLSDETARREIGGMVGYVIDPRRTVHEPGVATGEGVDEASEAGYRWDDDRLVIRATAATQEYLTGLLGAWNETGLGQITIGCTFMTSARELATAAGIAWQSVGAFPASGEEPLRSPSHLVRGSSGLWTVEPGVRASAHLEDHVPVLTAALDEQQTKALLGLAQSDPKASLLHSPKITLFNGQEVLIADVKPRVFVVGTEGPAGTPRTETIEQGTKIYVRAILKEDGRHIRLVGDMEVAHIQNVCHISTVIADGVRNIDVPRVARRRITIASEIESGQSLLVGCPPSFDAAEPCTYVLLTVRHLEPPEAATKK